jgi:hypothetical protein
VGLAGEEVSRAAGPILHHEPRLDGLLKELGPVGPDRSPDLADQQVARRRRNGRIPDAALAHKCLGKAALGQVAEDGGGEAAWMELGRAIEDIRGRRLMVLTREAELRKFPHECRGNGGLELKLKLLQGLEHREAGPDRLARYFTRGDGPTAQYLMVGVATQQGWTIMIIGVDILQDPMLRLRAEILQRLLSDINFPQHKYDH